MQSVSSRIWTRLAVFISYGDNDYTNAMMVFCSLVIITSTNHAHKYIEKEIKIFFLGRTVGKFAT